MSPTRVAVVVVLLLVPTPVRAQVETEPLAWAPEHRALADALGTAAVVGQATGATVVAIRAWRAGDRTVAFRTGCSVGLALVATESLKRLVHEVRPDGSDAMSWPSGHSAAGMALGWNYSFDIPIEAFIVISRSNANKHHLRKDQPAGVLLGIGTRLLCRAVIR